MKELLELGDSILEMLEGPLDDVEQVLPLIEQRATRIQQLKEATAEEKVLALHQDQLLRKRCGQVLHRIGLELRWKPKTNAEIPRFIDQRS